ncbi:MerR family transcriptional regulator [Pleionea sp. CnH1-48]|uniref:MerR family transcriptional regulator n=1 Tax=Pleionea sp. CnH1-48 TaxID=2954494 RepID=UPI0020969600|nr:MerR family transcriptional regulator [Pleionea sp. CnH1-48]MCO7223427.1 MerR family transcriptional regulator [Pleionea sp. CnH1-48]
MITVTQIAKRFGLSRATILYYEREGLLAPACRSENGYRWYDEAQIQRLQSILAYRSYGLPLADIAVLLDNKSETSQTHLLREHFHKLEVEINTLRKQQEAIVVVLQEPELLGKNSVTKERWVAIMRAAGFDDEAMLNWHKKFEEMEPEEHHRFLESLGIQQSEIEHIRSL